MARTTLVATCVFVVGGLCPQPAEATYSVLVADTRNNVVGVAAASCVPFSISDLYRASPGKGAVVAQAYSSTAGRDLASDLIGKGVPPGEIVAALSTPTFDPSANLRQYGLVDTRGRSAVFSGSSLDAWVGGRQGHSKTIVYAIQGNFLSNERVLVQLEKELLIERKDLSERLMMALEAASNGGEGDSRCTKTYSIPATAAFLSVDAADGRHLVRLSVLIRSGESAIGRLRQDLAAWRGAHPGAVRELNPPSAGCSVADGCAPGGPLASLTVAVFSVLVFLRAGKRSRSL